MLRKSGEVDSAKMVEEGGERFNSRAVRLLGSTEAISSNRISDAELARILDQVRPWVKDGVVASELNTSEHSDEEKELGLRLLGACLDALKAF